jgi:hypothetical protein
MSRKLFAGGMLLVVSFGLLLADRVSSQDKDVDKDKGSLTPLKAPSGPASLEQLVQELKNVRAQRVEFEKREQQLMAEIEKVINAERQQLGQKVQERLKQLDEIERLIHPYARGKEAKSVERFDKK